MLGDGDEAEEAAGGGGDVVEAVEEVFLHGFERGAGHDAGELVDVFFPGVDDPRVGPGGEPMFEQLAGGAAAVNSLLRGGVQDRVALFGGDGAVAPGDFDQRDKDDSRERFGPDASLSQAGKDVVFDDAGDVSQLGFVLHGGEVRSQFFKKLAVAFLEKCLFQSAFALFEGIVAVARHEKGVPGACSDSRCCYFIAPVTALPPAATLTPFPCIGDTIHTA